MSRPEARVETRLIQAAKSLGGQALKIVSPGLAGVPDRLVVLPLAEPCPCCGQRARHAFLEVKALGEEPDELQNAVARLLDRSGAHVAWVAGVQEAKSAIQALSAGQELGWRL